MEEKVKNRRILEDTEASWANRNESHDVGTPTAKKKPVKIGGQKQKRDSLIPMQSRLGRDYNRLIKTEPCCVTDRKAILTRTWFKTSGPTPAPDLWQVTKKHLINSFTQHTFIDCLSLSRRSHW